MGGSYLSLPVLLPLRSLVVTPHTGWSNVELLKSVGYQPVEAIRV